jgi:hypothetical protein
VTAEEPTSPGSGFGEGGGWLALWPHRLPEGPRGWAGWSPCPGRGRNGPFPQHHSPSTCPLVSAAAPAGPKVIYCSSPAALAAVRVTEVPCPRLLLCLDPLLSAACPPSCLSSGRGSAWNMLFPPPEPGADITCPSQRLPLSLPAQHPSTHSPREVRQTQGTSAARLGGATDSSGLNQKNLNSLSRADQQSPPGQKTRRLSRTPQTWDLRTLPVPGRLLEPESGRLPALSPWKRLPRRDKSRRAKGVPGATRSLLP